MLLKLQPTWVAVGRPFTIECRVPDVIPLENLTITLLRGNETLHIKTFGRMHDSQEARATHSITAHREDSHHNFSCQAELDLRSLGGEVVRCISEPQALMVYGEASLQTEVGGRGTPLQPLGGRENRCPTLCQLRGQEPRAPYLIQGLPLALPLP